MSSERGERPAVQPSARKMISPARFDRSDSTSSARASCLLGCSPSCTYRCPTIITEAIDDVIGDLLTRCVA